MAEMAKELLAAKLKLENEITALVNAFQKDSGTQVNWCGFSRRETTEWPSPVVFSTVELSLSEPKPMMVG
jgi:hypothetical protein